MWLVDSARRRPDSRRTQSFHRFDPAIVYSKTCILARFVMNVGGRSDGTGGR